MKEYSADARKAFAAHVVSRESEGRWLLQRRYPDGGFEWTMAAEVISLAGGALYVGGDIDYVIFSWFSDSGAHEDKVRWMGRCTDLEYYVRQKAAIGTGRDLVEMYDADEARRQLERDVDDRENDDPGDSLARELRALLSDGLDFEDRDALLHAIYEISSDFATDVCAHLGIVTHPRVYYAHAALARLCDLLDARQGLSLGATQ